MNSPANGARWRNDNSAAGARSDNIKHIYSMFYNVKCRLKQKPSPRLKNSEVAGVQELQNEKPAFRSGDGDSSIHPLRCDEKLDPPESIRRYLLLAIGVCLRNFCNLSDI